MNTPTETEFPNPRLFPPQIFAVSFFLLLSSCATLTQNDRAEDVWEKTTPGQEYVERADRPEEHTTAGHIDQELSQSEEDDGDGTGLESAPQQETGLNRIPGADRASPHERVASLPPAPSYRPDPGRVTPQPPVASVASRPIQPFTPLYPPLELTTPEVEIPQAFFDDLDPATLRESLRRQTVILEDKDPYATVRLGNLRVTQGRLLDTLVEFKKLLDANLPQATFNEEIQKRFYVIPAGLGMKHQVLFTGYYTPVITASKRWSEEFPYPLYSKPNTGQAMESTFERAMRSQRDYGFHLIASTRPVDLTREAIDGREVLADKNLEVAWLKDEMERYFLHIQGSGFLQFEDGQLEAVQYMGSNERPYKSVGRMLIKEGVITTGQGSMQGIKRYFRDHPEDIPKYLFKNERYIFFGMGGTGPRGSTGAELIGGRAIATDKRLYPGGGLVFITAEKPILNADNKIARWEQFSRFVLDQDTGSAIKGAGRADLYFGVGEQAGAQAGRFMKRGKMFYLLVR